MADSLQRFASGTWLTRSMMTFVASAMIAGTIIALGLLFITADGTVFTPNLRISAGTSNSHDAQNGIDYGDYTGLSFYGGVAHPAWSDNSNSTGNNPDGRLHQLDIYSAAVSDPLK